MHTLKDTIDIAGEWWAPENRDTMVPGQLTFSRDEGVRLQLNQAFDTPQGAVRIGDPNPRYECIHGTTVKGEAVTLFDVQQFGTSLHSGSGGLRQPGRIHARLLIMDAHLPPRFRFPAIYFQAPGLQVWLALPVISQEVLFDRDNKLLGQDYSLRRIPAETFTIPEIDSTISIFYGWSSKLDAYSSIQVSVAAGFKIKPDRPQLLDWYLEQEEKLLSLLSFLAGQLMVADGIHAQIDDSSHRVSVLFASKKFETADQKRQQDYFLSRSAISQPLSECCKKWFEVVSRVEKPAALAKSIMASNELWLHIEFLSLIQVLEGFHRSLYDGKYMSNESYVAVRAAMEKSIPENLKPSHKAALRSRVKYGNQYSLRKRLAELESLLSEEIRGHIFGPTKSIPASWVDTRNYYTHWDEELRDNILNNQEMYYANIRLTHFMCTLFRLLVEVPASAIESAFSGSSDLAQQLVNINIVEKRAADPSFLPGPIMTITSKSNRPDTAPPPDSTEEEPPPRS